MFSSVKTVLRSPGAVSLLFGRESGRLRSVARLSPETHRGGQSALRLEFENCNIYFKPRITDTADLWDTVAAEARRASIPLPNCPLRQSTATSYLEQEAEALEGFDAVDELAAVACVASCLFMTDLHPENILISQKKALAPVDVETMFQTHQLQHDSSTREWISRALMRTALFTYDKFTLCTASELLGPLEHDWRALVSRFTDRFVSIFPEMSQIVIDATNQLVRSRGDLFVRLPIRNTRWYGHVFQQLSTHPHDDVDLALTSMLAASAIGVPLDLASSRQVLERSEQIDLVRGDVPMFEMSIVNGSIRAAIDGPAQAHTASALNAAQRFWAQDNSEALSQVSSPSFQNSLAEQLRLADHAATLKRALTREPDKSNAN